MKTKITDFAEYLESFFIDYLTGEQGVSRETIRSYRDTFVLFIAYMDEAHKIPVDKLVLKDLNRNVILSFLNWLQDSRNNGISTRNQRYAAIRSFCNFLEWKDPTRLATWQSLRSIKTKKVQKATINHLTIDGMKCLLEQISTTNRYGRRNLALLSLLYESGARVQELINLKPSNIRLEKPAVIQLHGKGNKKRIVPLREQQIEILAVYMEENGLNQLIKNESFLFFNSRGTKLTSSGVTYILNTYAAMARTVNPNLIPEKISPHCIRHSRAMHLLQAGVNLVYIRDIMGHSSIQTTEIYARADSKLRREALEKASRDTIDIKIEIPSWEKDKELKSFLKNLV